MKIVAFIQAIARHIGDGCAKTTRQEMTARLVICEECPDRNGEGCGRCGCPIVKKASWRSEKCPAEKWPH